jgi:hypothetical protein
MQARTSMKCGKWGTCFQNGYLTEGYALINGKPTVTRMFRFRILLIFVALLSFVAVTDQALAYFAGHHDAGCASQNNTPGQNQNGGSCECICHQGLAAILSSARIELAPRLIVYIVAERVQHVAEAPPHAIDLPPQLA